MGTDPILAALDRLDAGMAALSTGARLLGEDLTRGLDRIEARLGGVEGRLDGLEGAVRDLAAAQAALAAALARIEGSRA
jgi:hypothetical protein